MRVRSRNGWWIAAAAGVAIGLGAMPAQAGSVNHQPIGASGNKNGPSTYTYSPLQYFGHNTYGWQIGSPKKHPQGVYLDNTQGPWVTKLGLIDNTDGNGQSTWQVSNGTSLLLKQYLQITKPLPWTDWHEKLFAKTPPPPPDDLKPNSLPNSVWSFGKVKVAVIFPGHKKPKPLKSLKVKSYDSALAMWFGKVIPVHSILLFSQQIVYNGAPIWMSSNSLDGNGKSYLKLAQYPTTTVPAPASVWGGLGLLAALGLFILKRRTRTSAA